MDSTLTLAFSFEKNYTLKCFNCSTNDYSFEEPVSALHPIPSIKEKGKSTCTLILEVWHDFYHSYHIFIIFV